MAVLREKKFKRDPSESTVLILRKNCMERKEVLYNTIHTIIIGKFIDILLRYELYLSIHKVTLDIFKL